MEHAKIAQSVQYIRFQLTAKTFNTVLEVYATKLTSADQPLVLFAGNLPNGWQNVYCNFVWFWLGLPHSKRKGFKITIARTVTNEMLMNNVSHLKHFG